MKIRNSRTAAKLLFGILFAGAVLACGRPAVAQAECAAEGYRVVAQRWDAVLRMGWELRQDCVHPEWPARLVATNSVAPNGRPRPNESLPGPIPMVRPLLVHAGDPVRLWAQDERVRIEMSGVAEQSAHGGDRVVVRIMRQTGDEGLTVEHVAGTVRGVGDVEMER